MALELDHREGNSGNCWSKPHIVDYGKDDVPMRLVSLLGLGAKNVRREWKDFPYFTR